MYQIIKKNRILLSEDLTDIEKKKLSSPALFGSYQKIVPAIQKYVRGKVIDIGCGTKPYKNKILQYAATYDSLDIEARVPGVTYIGDIQYMGMIDDVQYDTILCFDVLEHVRDSHAALQEMCRILKSGGVLVISIPHLSRIHEEPNDYYRYTKYGIQYMLQWSGFEVVEIEPFGGLCSFIGHQISTVVISLCWRLSILKQFSLWINFIFCVLPCYYLDTHIDKNKIFALGYVCIAKKR